MIRWPGSRPLPPANIPETPRPASPPADPAVVALANEAMAHYTAKKFAAAEAAIRRALVIAPNDPELWNALGVFQRMDGRAQDALQSYRHALSLSGNHAGVWSNLGNALKDLKFLDSAITSQRRAVELQPLAANFQHNLALALIAANRQPEAIEALDRACALDPADYQIRWDRSLARLQVQDFKRGWSDYAARFELGEIPKRELPGQSWQGRRYRKKRLLVLSEQGFGDFIWASRYLRKAKSLGGELVVECRPELRSLVESMGIADRVIVVGEPLPEADLHCYVCSLPALFTPKLRAVPAPPYMTAQSERRGVFERAMKPAGRQLRVGLVWSGSITSKANSDRALPLESFIQAFAIPGVQLFSLQKGAPHAQLTRSAELPVIDLSPLLNDFADTAAAIGELDLVIMTDSAVAHLAGAMGKPCWLLLNTVPFWLWFKDRADSPWYPSLRLFRSRIWGDWIGPLDAASIELARLIAKRSPPST